MLKKKRIVALLGALIILLACLPGCPAKPQAPRAELDTPGHHVITGNKFLAAGKLADAQREFTRATELDPEYAPAYAGLGLVAGTKGDYKAGLELMRTADKKADGDVQLVETCVGYIRLYTMGKTDISSKWLAKSLSRYEKAIRLAPDDSAPHYYMGVAYKNACEFLDAATLFSRVLDLDKDFVFEADREYAEMQKIQRAMPGTAIGKKIALLPKITRADVAALFVEELKVDELFSRRTPKKFDTSFKSPEKNFVTEKTIKALAATDIANHVLKADIEAVMAVGVKGLQPYPDHTYRPYELITRSQFAMMMEDILIKITGDEKIVTKFIGETSPFPDVRSDVAYFNSLMVVTTRGIMKAKDVATGEFDAMGVVPGADALLGIRVLKGQLKK